MATRKKPAAASAARDLREKLGRAQSKLKRAVEKLADLPDEERVEVQRSRGGRTITVVNRGGITVGTPRKRTR